MRKTLTKPILRKILLAGLVLAFLVSGITTLPGKAQGYQPPYYVEQVTDIAQGHGSSDPAWLTVMNNEIYFQAAARNNGAELWKYSPYTGESILVKDILTGRGGSNPEWLTVYGSTLFFAATDATRGRELWAHNSETGVTQIFLRLGEFPNGSDPKWLHIMGNTLFFSAHGEYGQELYAYDLVAGNVRMVKNINRSGSSDPQFIYSIQNTLYFVADDNEHGRELWRSDGTTAGTYMVKDIYPGPESSDPSSFNALGPTLYFSAESAVQGRELWQTRGTEATTRLVRDIWEGKPGSDPGWSNRLGHSMIMFPADTEAMGTELWRYDPVYGAVPVMDINAGEDDSNPAPIGDVGWAMFFAADDGDLGTELWRSEPPYFSAQLVQDIFPGEDSSEPKLVERLGTTLFFTANDGDHGEELWVSESPYVSAHMVADIRPGSTGSIPQFTFGDLTGTLSNAVAMGWSIYFTANNGTTGVELYRVSPNGVLPGTGFPAGETITLPPRPASSSYFDVEDIRLEIPSLSQDLPIVGIPRDGNSWDVEWLFGDSIGYLEGTAFPTWEGNTVLSGHRYLTTGEPGPFVNLDLLSWDDEIIIHAWGQEYVYHVRSSEVVSPEDMTAVGHRDNDWVTLVTCLGYDEEQHAYQSRIVVYAVLVDVR